MSRFFLLLLSLATLASAATVNPGLDLGRNQIDPIKALAGTSRDATSVIQSALNLGGEVVIPSGSYRVESTLTVGLNTTLRLSAGVTLTRPAAAASTAPVVHLKNSRSKLIGGTIVTEKASPNGVVLVGHLDSTSTWNTDNSLVEDVYVVGLQSAGNIGIKLMSSQPYLGTSYSSYFHTLMNVDIRKCDIGILLSEKSNGNAIINAFFWDCITSAICLSGAYGNTIENGFVHTSTNGVIGIQFLDHGSLAFSTHHADSNSVLGFNIEPSGASSKGVTISANSTGNRIDIMGNVAGGNTISNENNTVLSRYGTQLMATDRTIAHSGRSTGLNWVRNQKSSSTSENSSVDLLTVALGSNRRIVVVEISIVAHNATSDNATVLQAKYLIERDNAGVVSAPTLLGTATQEPASSPLVSLSTSVPVAGSGKITMNTANLGGASTTFWSYEITVRGTTTPSVTWH